MKLAFVMDPISQISYKKDSTLAMMVEAQEKGHEIFYIEPDCLFFNSDEPCAVFSPISVKYEESSWYEKGENNISSLDFFDAILMRQDQIWHINRLCFCLHSAPNSTAIYKKVVCLNVDTYFNKNCLGLLQTSLHRYTCETIPSAL